MNKSDIQCRCGGHTAASIYPGFVRETKRIANNAPEVQVERNYLWVGMTCTGCGRRWQFGMGGEPGDYKHARWWSWGKHYESMGGRPRRGSDEFWEFIVDVLKQQRGDLEEGVEVHGIPIVLPEGEGSTRH